MPAVPSVVPTLNYVIAFVADMDAAVRFYRDTVGLLMRFESPEWSEFDTGETTLALHPANDTTPAGSMQIGLGVPDVRAYHESLMGQGVRFTSEPTEHWGATLAQFVDGDGRTTRVSSPDPHSGSWKAT